MTVLVEGKRAKVCSDSLVPMNGVVELAHAFSWNVALDVCSFAGMILLKVVCRLLVPQRAVRIFPVMDDSPLGMLLRSNNYLEGRHNSMKNYDLP